MRTFVFSLGGSLICPDGISESYIDQFRRLLHDVRDRDVRIYIVVGGGSIAREYQQSLRVVSPEVDHDTLDLLGIAATRVNASILAALLDAPMPVPCSPDEAFAIHDSQFVVMGGWKPGFSTDTVSVYLAQKSNAGAVYNFSNVSHIYDKDPRTYSDAAPIDELSWDQYFRLFQDLSWKPGLHAPFDPIASKLASENLLRVYIANGQNPDIIRDIVGGVTNTVAIGTVIG